MVAIGQYINASYIDRLTGLSRGEQRGGAALSRALRGGSSESKISSSFRFGGQAYTQALSGINFAASLLNFARSDLEQMNSIVGRALEHAEEAAKPTTSTQRRRYLNRELGDFGREFREIERGAKVGERDYLTKKGIQDVFTTIGLDPNESRSVNDAFDVFIVVDEEQSLASREIQGQDTQISAAAGKPKAAQLTSDLFDARRDILRQADAQAVVDDLRALSGQIQGNLAAIDNATELLLDHTYLVRQTAISMLELREALGSDVDATEAAKELARAIRKAPASALAHIENLEPLIVASLTLEDAGIVSNSDE